MIVVVIATLVTLGLVSFLIWSLLLLLKSPVAREAAPFPVADTRLRRIQAQIRESEEHRRAALRR